MDIISHGLWAGIALGRKKRNTYLWSFFFGLLPDILAEGIMFLLLFAGLIYVPGWPERHPQLYEFPENVQHFYNATHSLVIFVLLFFIVFAIRKKVYLPLLAWGIHIAIDIPTHSFELFPTPFLWPVSSFKINGVAWRNPEVLITNFCLLFIVYTAWFIWWRKRRNATDV